MKLTVKEVENIAIPLLGAGNLKGHSLFIQTFIDFITKGIHYARIKTVNIGATDDRSPEERYLDYKMVFTNNLRDTEACKIVESIYSHFGLVGLASLWERGYPSADQTKSIFRQCSKDYSKLGHLLLLE